ncbi:Com family DNA-binding transcriptional regulator [Actinobacillus delphinicola]
MQLRCKCCNKLLGQAKEVKNLEIKCVRCKRINTFNHSC